MLAGGAAAMHLKGNREGGRAAAFSAALPSAGGAWVAPNGLIQIPLWPGTPPDTPSGPLPKETTQTGTNPKRFAGLPVTGVYDVTLPTMTVFPAKGKPTGAAMLVFPGGGFMQLAIDLEGTEACDWMTAKGIACVLVKYRVPNSNHHYDEKCDCGVTPPHLTALQDAQRAIRLVRSQASSLKIDPQRIGVIGFSAGGYLVAQTSNIFAPAYKPVDAIDRISSRPNFGIALYPGHLCRNNGKLDPGLNVSEQTPPQMLIQAWDDPTDPVCNSIVYARALASFEVPTELHLFAKGGHAFGFRPTGLPVSRWPALAEDWLRGLDMISR
ncbi:MAG: alpha/beta hydrolase [Novosphingobium sp.]